MRKNFQLAIRDGRWYAKYDSDGTEAGNFVDCGTTEMNINRSLTSKNVRLFGVTNHPFTHYAQSLKLFQQYAKWIPFNKIVTHRYKIDDALEGLKRSTQPDTMKVVIEP